MLFSVIDFFETCTLWVMFSLVNLDTNQILYHDCMDIPCLIRFWFCVYNLYDLSNNAFKFKMNIVKRDEIEIADA